MLNFLDVMWSKALFLAIPQISFFAPFHTVNKGHKNYTLFIVL